MGILTKHAIDLLCKSPLDYWWHYENPERPAYVESADSKFDKALRMSVFDRTAFDVIYVRTRKFDFRKHIDVAEHRTMETATLSKGQIMLNTELYDKVLQMRSALLKHPIASKLIGGATESFYSVFNTEGVSIQFKPHALHPGFGHGCNLINLTHTKDASESGFSKSSDLFGWHRKAAIQIDGTDAIEMIFIVCEDKEPFNIGVYVLDERALDFGRQNYKEAIERYKESAASGVWAGVSPSIVTAGLPEWAYRK